MRLLEISILTLTLAFTQAQAASAQGTPVRFEVTPAAGGVLFAGELPASFQLESTSGTALTLSGVERSDALAAGGRAAVRVGDHFSIGAGLFYSPLTYTSAGADEDGGLFTYGADIAFHAVELSPVLQPFLVAGAGAKSYDFEGANLVTDFMWNAGGGVDLKFTPQLALRMEARDYMSQFASQLDGVDDEIQHDLVLSAGLSFSFGPGADTQSARVSGPVRVR